MPPQSFSLTQDDDDDDELTLEKESLINGGFRGGRHHGRLGSSSGILGKVEAVLGTWEQPSSVAKVVVLLLLVFLLISHWTSGGAAKPASSIAAVPAPGVSAAAARPAAPALRTKPTTRAPVAAVAAPIDRPAPMTPPPISQRPRSRGLLGDGDELSWAEDNFGMYLQEAIPYLEDSANQCQTLLRALTVGQCEIFAGSFAPTGSFNFNLPAVQAEVKTREEVFQICTDTLSAHLVALRLMWYFPDRKRYSGSALLEVFTQSPNGAIGAVQKSRWAFFASLDAPSGPEHIVEFKLYAESTDADRAKLPPDFQKLNGAIVQANLQRINGHDCNGFSAVLPASGTENWLLQSLPLGTAKADELDEKPRDQIVAKCNKDAAGDADGTDFQYASVEGVFPSASGQEAMFFFHNEKQYKGTMDVTDDPEALVLKLYPGTSPPSVHTLYFFTTEALHISQEWGWKYGWASQQS
eukprot:gnl/TRDRNA2_/TRDRNA2_191643_c0_seq1.p1 gnl/TRDRNA2_/TRDRNA2_191643_c0~~gnl/TRDRNA2_/TRDRNA2_191643_c0_seq1.p1  ORF type:complete len:467 (+),score=74.87 gnl/TRDRNA2_/TRDRNA2_191643_c0_seq1:85-1485(+)